MKFLLIVFLLLAAAMFWQHTRYLHARRDFVRDRQRLFYDTRAFHALTFVRVAPGFELLEELRGLRLATQEAEGIDWVYAGKVVMNGNVSQQLGPVDWSAVILLQYPTRSAYESMATSEPWRAALARFAESYTQGFERPALPNLLLPQALLLRRWARVLRREPSNFPFERMPGIEERPEVQTRIGELLGESDLGAHAIAIVNLQKVGTPEQRAADARYTGRMLSAMAEGGYGPMHLGRAIRVERGLDFDRVAIVYYPGVEFFADLVRSTFFQKIIGDKQLGDTQASITVPILDRL